MVQRKSNEIMTIYSDTDLVFREENEIFGGQKFASDTQQASMQLQ